jgi:hypothetical protein
MFLWSSIPHPAHWHIPGEPVMLRISLGTLVVLCLAGTASWAQLFVGPGSTVQGDYLRGVGVAAFGMGVYNKATAEANSINLDTSIRWNEYVSSVLKNENRENALHRQAEIAKREENYNKIERRIRENPEERDVQNGDALNAELDKLLDPKLSSSFFLNSPVPLSVDAIRAIPFKLDAEGVRFSMQRLSPKGKGKWPVALQDARFASERSTYERAFDNALEQQINGKMSLDAIVAVETAVEDLYVKLDRVVKPGEDKLYLEAKRRLNELNDSAKLLKSHKIEGVIGELDKYSGTTVNDLRLFMEKNKLRFGRAENAQERELYPMLYAILKQQRERVTSP